MRHHCFREVAKMAHTCCVLEAESVSLAGLGVFPRGTAGGPLRPSGAADGVEGSGSVQRIHP